MCKEAWFEVSELKQRVGIITDTYLDYIELQEVDTYTQKMKDIVCENYFNHMAYHILKLNAKLNGFISSN